MVIQREPLFVVLGDSKKEPPYDDITARESLSHIRERYVHEQMTSSSPAAFRDGTFNREYDEIKVERNFYFIKYPGIYLFKVKI